MKSFGKRLREARVAAEMTQEQLGFELGVTKSSVSAWENDRETPSFRILSDLRSTLKRSLDELVCGIESSISQAANVSESQARNAQEMSLLTRYRDLSVQRQKAVLELIKPQQ